LGGLFLASRDDPVEDRFRVGVAGEDAFEVEDGQSAEPAHLDGQPGPDDSIHGGGDDREIEPTTTELPRDVDFIRIDRDGSGDHRDVVDPAGNPGFAPPPHPHPHAVPPRAWCSPRPGDSIYRDRHAMTY